MRAILLIPAPGDPHGLLAPGKCGAMPPSVYDAPIVGWVTAETLSRRTHGSFDLDEYENGLDRAIRLDYRQALVLAWDGEPVPEGCDRAVRCLEMREGYGIRDQPGHVTESTNGDCFILWPSG